jgi:alpha-tubulin suppressor-like RCC1 family protein
MTCAVLTIGTARCWGYGGNALGYGNGNTLYSPGGDLNIDGGVAQIAVGGSHTCALVSTGKVRCWGDGYYGPLGYGNQNTLYSPGGDVSVGGIVRQISVGASHTCALLTNGNVRCWGYGGAGALGYGSMVDIGDNELPSSAGDVNVGGNVVQVGVGRTHTCAVLSGGTVRCWGYGYHGALGYGTTTDLYSPGSDVNVGGYVSRVAAGNGFTCALLSTGKARCWGKADDGRLGYGNLNNIGDNELPSTAGDVNVGVGVIGIASGGSHTCALLSTGKVRCWGDGDYGKLGYGNTNNIGDNELPSTAGDVQAQ